MEKQVNENYLYAKELQDDYSNGYKYHISKAMIKKIRESSIGNEHLKDMINKEIALDEFNKMLKRNK